MDGWMDLPIITDQLQRPGKPKHCHYVILPPPRFPVFALFSVSAIQRLLHFLKNKSFIWGHMTIAPSSSAYIFCPYLTSGKLQHISINRGCLVSTLKCPDFPNSKYHQLLQGYTGPLFHSLKDQHPVSLSAQLRIDAFQCSAFCSALLFLKSEHNLE